MLYFAISFILIISGIFLLLYSFLSQSESGKVPSVTDKSPIDEDLSQLGNVDDIPVPKFFVEDISEGISEDISSEETLIHVTEGSSAEELRHCVDVSDNVKIPEVEELAPVDEVVDEPNSEDDNLSVEDFVLEDISTTGLSSHSEEKAEVALYFDSSSIVDYENSRGVIDPTLEGYRHISRVGRGNLLYEKDGLNFYMGKKLFRFDFYRIEDLWTGENHLSLALKDGNAVNLFVFGEKKGLIETIDSHYRNFRSTLL